jgi:hypothetical protein
MGAGGISVIAVLVALERVAGGAEALAHRTDQPPRHQMLRLDMSFEFKYISQQFKSWVVKSKIFHFPILVF